MKANIKRRWVSVTAFSLGSMVSWGALAGPSMVQTHASSVDHGAAIAACLRLSSLSHSVELFAKYLFYEKYLIARENV